MAEPKDEEKQGGGEPNPDIENQGGGESRQCTYVCTEDCIYRGVYRHAGDTIVLEAKKNVPHFKPVK